MPLVKKVNGKDTCLDCVACPEIQRKAKRLAKQKRKKLAMDLMAKYDEQQQRENACFEEEEVKDVDLRVDFAIEKREDYDGRGDKTSFYLFCWRPSRAFWRLLHK